MKRKMLGLTVALILMLPVAATATTVQDFQVKETQDLIDLCTTSPEESNFKEAVHFCHGYLVGAFHYYKVTHVGPDVEPFVCFPDPPPTRNEAIRMFIDWAQAHPEYMTEAPVETEFRFLIETWPCK